MPLLPTPTTQELEDHFFGSGAFEYGWFSCNQYEHFPVSLYERDEGSIVQESVFTEEDFLRGIKLYAETLPERTFQDLIEDMDAVDVDNCIQLAYFGEIRYG